MPLRLNYFSLTCSICALAAIILQLLAMECHKLHIVDSPINSQNIGVHYSVIEHSIALLGFLNCLTEERSEAEFFFVV